MVTKKHSTVSAPKVPSELLISREEAKSKLQERIKKGHEIEQNITNSSEIFDNVKNEYSKWNSFNVELLKRIFTTEEFAKEYSFWGGAIKMSMGPPSIEERRTNLYKDINQNIHKLDSIIERLELIPLNNTASTTTSSEKLTQASTKSKKVFVVHGHDEIAKTNLEVFLREIGLEPVVLHRQADEGQTVIEKFEKHSDVGYAFILLTPDEVAYIKSDDSKNDNERKKEFRARPNVIFEFGYFVGKLGRSRVCCLYTGDVSLPSDVSGMIYKKFTNSIEDVAYSIIKDLKVSGYEID